MSTVIAVHYFEVDQFWVGAEVLGARYTAVVGGYRCTLVVPRSSEGADQDLEWLPGPDAMKVQNFHLLRGWIETPEGERAKWRVGWVKVEVELPSALLAGDLAGDPSGERREEVIELIKVARDVSIEFVTRIMRHAAVTYRQPWLGPSAKLFLPGFTSGRLYDRNGEWFRAGYGVTKPGVLRLGVSAPNHQEFEALVSNISGAGYVEPPLAETLLADALYTSSSADHPDLRLATLLAAMACEVKIKQAMRILATQEQAALVDALLDNPRDWSMAASSLFDKGIAAVCGRSMRVEDRPLWKRVDRLFFVRNKVAHVGGEGLEPTAISEGHPEAARDAFEWVDRVIVDSASRPPDDEPASQTSATR
ncbi:hypothetical protein [Nonomuraea endophytica]|uniref:Uncharacterized protein n=1 Tax=Nonomuraea endophytica TaxID=714136 RepID=A0A7W8A1E6_9ACTN|nr:hypothetical protein [Nonomuraea endophytica]MBB5077782.1 hypothetical protein [Nonomuraea endophytica]